MRRRLGLSIAGVATVAVLLFAVPLAIILGGAHRTEDLLRLQRDTFAATRQIDLPGATDDPVELPRSPDSLAAYDRAGRRIAGTGPATAPAVVRTAIRTGRSTDARADGALVVAVPIVSRERVVGAVRAQRAEGESSGDTAQQRLAVAGLGLGVVLMAILAALWLGRALARPLERLAVTATRLGHGDFLVRAAPSGIAEVDAVGAALESTAGRLEETVNRERAFSADASHQLRTPLQALRIELEAVELRGDAPPEIRAALVQADRLETTIATLLAVARDAPRATGTTAVASVVETARARWHGPLAATSRPLRVALPPDLPPAGADPHVVTEILEVLLDNATRHGAGAVAVTVRALDGWLAIDVSDEGPGFAIDPEEAFARSSRGDHGIGLPLARSLAHAEGGRLTVTRATPAPVITLFLRTT
jgi:signal transduction histidine kinase